MSEAIRIAHPSQALHIGKAGITYAEMRELQKLLDEAADACDAAAVLLEEDCAPPTGPDLQRIRELTAPVGAMVDRIGAILEIRLSLSYVRRP